MRTIQIPSDSILDIATVDKFTESLRSYIAKRGEIRHALSRLTGHQFNTTDYVSFFTNEHGEMLIFRQARGGVKATLLHSDFDWKPVTIDPVALTQGEQLAGLDATSASDLARILDSGPMREFMEKRGDLAIEAIVDIIDKIPIVGNELIINQQELAWLRTCREASNWWRSAPT